MHFNFISIIFLVLLFPVFSNAALIPAQGNNVGIGTVFNDPQFAKGRLIVKFNDKVDQPVDIAFKQKRLLKSISKTPTNLDSLMKQIKVTNIRPLFAQDTVVSKLKTQKKSITTANIKAQQNADWEALKKKYPKRAKRMSNPKSQVVDLFNIYIIEFDPDIDVLRAAELFKQDPSVVYAEPDYLINLNDFPQDPPNDPNYKDQWNLELIKVDEAWKKTLGEGIVVAVVDSGVKYTHPDLINNIWVNPCEDINHNGRVDDSDFDSKDTACSGEEQGNGFIDDIRGYNFSNCLGQDSGCSNYSNEVMDVQNHGTPVASIIAAKANNNSLISGVSPAVKVMSLKSSNDVDGRHYDSSIINSIKYAVDSGADIINNSWGDACVYCSMPVREVLDYAYNAGVVLVFAAGNARFNLDNMSPYTKAIIVAGIDENKVLYFNNNYGNAIDVFAPGVNVPAIVIDKGTIYSKSGTSFAAPHVSAALALVLANQNSLLEKYPYFRNFTNAQLEILIRSFSPKGILDIPLLLSVSSVIDANFGIENNSVLEIENLGIVNIPISLNGAGLKSARLYYRKDPTTRLIPIGNVIVKEGNFIIPWNLKGLSVGDYWLKIVAVSQDGYSFTKEIKVSLKEFIKNQIKIDTAFSERFFYVANDKYLSWLEYDAGNSKKQLKVLDLKSNRIIKTIDAPSSHYRLSDELVVFLVESDSGNYDTFQYYKLTTVDVGKIKIPRSELVGRGSLLRFQVFKDKIIYLTDTDNVYANSNTGLKIINTSDNTSKMVNIKYSNHSIAQYDLWLDNEIVFYKSQVDEEYRDKKYSFYNISNDTTIDLIPFSESYQGRDLYPQILGFFNKKVLYTITDYFSVNLNRIYGMTDGSIKPVEQFVPQRQGRFVNSLYLKNLDKGIEITDINSDMRWWQPIKEGYSYTNNRTTLFWQECQDGNHCELYSAPLPSLKQKLFINRTGNKGANDLFEIVSEPKGISCGSRCVASFDKGSSITLSLRKLDGNKGWFDGWPIKACQNKSTCTIKLDNDEVLNLKFLDRK